MEIFLTKLLHISILSLVIMFLGIFFSKNLNSLYPDNEEIEKKKTSKIILHLVIFTCLIYISQYFIRNILQYINQNVINEILFWNKSINYDINRIKEVGGGVAMAFSMFLFKNKYRDDIRELFNKRINIDLFNDKEEL
tara:strand:- start:427 stop:840 length:414 start_codon:yes stop_codon:yes gene_type:complete